MIIQEHTFTYFDKSFKFPDLSVMDYLRICRGQEGIIEDLLKKHNTDLEINMNSRQIAVFMDIILGRNQLDGSLERAKGKKKEKKSKKAKIDLKKDFHIFICQMGLILKQPWSEIYPIPLNDFFRIYADLEIITGKESYEDVRDHDKPDLEGFKGIENLQKSISKNNYRP